MSRDLKERMRARIRARLDELKMSARELARSIRPDEDEGTLDSWISSILTGRAALTWDYVDAACEKLGISPSELVRDDRSELRELQPHEMELLRHYQQWPRGIQDHWRRILEYFTSTGPDQTTQRLLDVWRGLSEADQKRLLLLLPDLLRGMPPRNGEHGTDPPESI